MPLQAPGAKTAQKNTFGGFATATFFSGKAVPVLTSAPGAVAAGADVLLFSGAGRLDLILANPPFFSGLQLAVVFYDAGAVSSGGPFPASGHKVIGYLPQMVALVSGNAPISGNAAAVGIVDLMAGNPRVISMPFQSGLCVNLASGQPGFTVCWTPEINTQQ